MGCVGCVVARQHSLLPEPETVVAAEHRLERGAVGGQVARRNAEHRERLRGKVVQNVVGLNGRAHTVTAEDDHLLELRVIGGLSREKGNAEESQSDQPEGACRG